MNALDMARTAYNRPEAPSRTPRAVEHDLFSRITRRLGEAWAVRKQDFPALAAAVHDNNRLWSTLAADVADPGNTLSPDLRAQLFYLHEFSQTHGARVLAGEASAEILIEINTAIMRGLRGERRQG